MKKQLISIVALIGLSANLFGQGGNLGNTRTATNFLGFNALGGPPGALNIRNDWNRPILFKTSGVLLSERMRIHQVTTGNSLLPIGVTYPVSAISTAPNNGLTRIGFSYDSNTGIPLVPYSLLHGGDASQAGGVRDWMDLGLLFTRNTDHGFFGTRQKDLSDATGRTSSAGVANNLGVDANDVVIGFGDNASGPAGVGSDNLTFIFTDSHQPATNVYTGPNFHNSVYGREIMRMTGMGNVGIGPVFFDNAQPQNMLHVNNDANNQAYLQFTNSLNTGQTATDGFHIGITPGVLALGGIAEINQRENKDMRFFTNNIQRMMIEPGAINDGQIGINTNTPNNRLEITSSATDPQPAGLRFTNLTSAATPGPNPGTGVLSVNASGDVIYVPATSGGGGLVACPTALNDFVTKFISPTQVCRSQIYDDGTNVGVATITPGARLAVRGQGVGAGTTFQTEDNTGLPTLRIFDDGHAIANSRPINSTGWFFQVDANSGGGEGTQFESFNTTPKGSVVKGVQANVNGNTTAGAQGFVTDVINSAIAIASPPVPIRNYGLRAQVIAAGNENFGVTCAVGGGNSFTDNYGGSFLAAGTANFNYGGYFVANGGTNNYAVFATSFTGPAGFFSGDVFRTGTDNFTSDRKLKQNINALNGALDKIMLLKPKTYYFRTEEYKYMGLPKGQRFGLIAQEMEEVFPELVNDALHPEIKDEKGNQLMKAVDFKAVDYVSLIPVLIGGIQEQQLTIETQNEKINDLQNQIDELKKLITATPAGNNSNGTITYDVELSDKGIVVLDQNVPNPFAEQTVINYIIPEGTGKAQMLFYNASGQLIKAVEITEKGKGQLNVFASDLSNGMYTYTLVVDRKVMGTKKWKSKSKNPTILITAFNYLSIEGCLRFTKDTLIKIYCSIKLLLNYAIIAPTSPSVPVDKLFIYVCNNIFCSAS